MNSPSSSPKVLICDDDQTYQLALRHALKKHFEVLSAYNGDEAVAIVKNRKIDLILLDIQIRSSREGLDYIHQLKAVDEDLSIVMLSGLKDFETVREAMQKGAMDYIPKDSNPEELLHSIQRTLEKRALLHRREQQNYETTQLHRQHSFVGESPSILALKRLIEKIRNSMANVVIYGETGTGKEVVARNLRGQLPDGTLAPFVSVDSATIHSETAESILFGHEKGAFTGADRPRKGMFEEANNGIVYFDEIANMSLEIQSKLLRAIQEKEVTRLGSSRPIPLQFRVIAATNRDLEELIRLRLFKDDLYQRLNVVPITIPALRERTEDIPALLEHFARLHSKPGHSLFFTEDSIQCLQSYPWPGNIRELGNLVAYLIATTDQEEIDIPDLPPKFRDQPQSKAMSAIAGADGTSKSFYEKVGEFEKQLLQQEYIKSAGNMSRLALKLGMDRSHLYTKLRLYGIHTKSKAAPSNTSTESAAQS